MKATRKGFSSIWIFISQVHRYTVVIVDSFHVSFALSAPDLTSTQSESFARRQQQWQVAFIGSD
jgi:hypothetical protein